MLNKITRQTLIFILLIITVVFDQITKVIARNTLSSVDELSYLGNMLTLRHTENTGAFLSLGSDLPESARFWIFSVMVSVGLGYVLWQLLRDKVMGQFETVCWAIIIGGGIGNLIDRIGRGSVTDFLNVGIGNLRTGIFNVADMAVTFGAIALLLIAIRNKFSAPAKS